MKDELSQAYNDLLDELRAFEQKLRDADPPLPEADLLDGYRLGFTAPGRRRRLCVGRQGQPDSVRRHRSLPEMGWGQPDAYYQCMPVDPARTYRVSGNRATRSTCR